MAMETPKQHLKNKKKQRRENDILIINDMVIWSTSKDW